MRWLLAGCCGLALINLSALLQVTQKPRFYGEESNRNVAMHCYTKQQLPATVHWYKSEAYDMGPEDRVMVKGERVEHGNRNLTQKSVLYIRKVQVTDSGVYFCRINDTWGPGTQLIATKPIDLSLALYRSSMKDGFIVFQGLLLVVYVAALLLRTQTLTEKKESIYEQPEMDHIYEGLAIDTCGGGVYEELSLYAQADGAEAPWE